MSGGQLAEGIWQRAFVLESKWNYTRDLTSTYQTEYYLVIVAWCLSEVLDSLESVMLIIYLLVEFLYNECSIFDY